MASELIEICREDGTATGAVKTRSEVHRLLCDWHKVTAVFVRDSAGNFLIHRRSLFKESNAGLWTHNFGGHVTEGEKPEENAERELVEELGCKVRTEAMTFRGIQKFPMVKHIDYIYYYDYEPEDGSFCPCPDEVAEIRWMSAKELLSWDDQHEFSFNLYDCVREDLEQACMKK